VAKICLRPHLCTSSFLFHYQTDTEFSYHVNFFALIKNFHRKLGIYATNPNPKEWRPGRSDISQPCLNCQRNNDRFELVPTVTRHILYLFFIQDYWRTLALESRHISFPHCTHGVGLHGYLAPCLRQECKNEVIALSSQTDGLVVNWALVLFFSIRLRTQPPLHISHHLVSSLTFVPKTLVASFGRCISGFLFRVLWHLLAVIFPTSMALGLGTNIKTIGRDVAW